MEEEARIKLEAYEVFSISRRYRIAQELDAFDEMKYVHMASLLGEMKRYPSFFQRDMTDIRNELKGTPFAEDA